MPTAERYVPEVVDMRSQIDFGHFKPQHVNQKDIIVIHSTYSIHDYAYSLDGVVAQFRHYNVCPHYIIDRDGRIIITVDDDFIAYHAGRSTLPGTDRQNINADAFGIEIINTPWSAPTPRQYAALLYLTGYLRHRYRIDHIVRHSDISPQLKDDPWLFDWQRFNRALKPQVRPRKKGDRKQETGDSI